jgi:hypothetical protein
MATNTRKLAALLGASGAGIADAGTINTAGITADAIDNTKIADNAVNDENIAAGQVVADIAAGTVTTAMLADNAVSDVKLNANVTDGSIIQTEVKPHIIPGTLYPAVAGKLLDGSTSHGATYGVAQADGVSYYYTDIKGSKPIKDPRIGAHFGSQRHKFKSLQLLEQETATHGVWGNVYSIDGREWLRAVDTHIQDGGTWSVTNNDTGTFISVEHDSSGAFFEVTGYFNDINFSTDTAANRVDAVKLTVNGTVSATSGSVGGRATLDSPLVGRYVDAGSLQNQGSTVSTSLGTSPKINTLKYEITSGSSEYLRIYGIELIAQDTTSTTTKSQIQIPSQNVVSYGKKFTIADTPHYNPFAFKTDGTTAWTAGNHNGTAWPVGTGASANIDTATSLGLAAWVSTNYYYPYNGGRVIWWVDSSGTLKCSVNMMPPNARNIGPTASNEKGDDSAGTTSAAVANTQYLPTFTDIAIDHSQAEVAKTFHFREFGNGNANGGNSGTYKDASMITTTEQDIAYVMDDGLTSMSGNGKDAQNTWYRKDNDSFVYLTFIGTGITVKQDLGVLCYAQNLPYGTHILKKDSNTTTANSDIILDGVTLKSAHVNDYNQIEEVTFHQPKRPPIPENAVVIADYMLMADFVPQTAGGIGLISKGVRSNSATRDIFHDDGTGTTYYTISPNLTISPFGLRVNSGANASSATDTIARLPSFGTNYSIRGFDVNARHALYVDSESSISTMTHGSSSGNDSFGHLASSVTLGVHKFGANAKNGNQLSLNAMEVVTPIHTSHHYQSFESPFLHELVGGDRNMEQSNLIVTPDGKSWDEVTRDVSYLSNVAILASRDGGDPANETIKYDLWRGKGDTINNYVQKYFAIAYDRITCLVDGHYQITTNNYVVSIDAYIVHLKNNASVATANTIARGRTDPADSNLNITSNVFLQRGDFIVIYAEGTMQGQSELYNYLNINRLSK